MKKTLLTILGFTASLASIAQQTPSPSWTTVQNSNFPITSAGTKFLDAVGDSVVWAVGYDGSSGNVGRNYNWMVRSTDGGATFNWAPVFASTVTPGIGDTNTFVISNIDAINSEKCWVSAYMKAGGGSKGGIFRTIDGGTSWNQVIVPSMYANATSFCNIVVFNTDQTGITMGDPNPSTGNEFEIWRTTDGGNNWTLVPGANIPNPTAGEFGLVNVYEKYSSNLLWFGTNKGRILRSTDGGLNWNVSTVTDASISATSSINDIAFSSPSNGAAYVYTGTTPNFTFTMYNTNDGGATWTLIPTPDPNAGRNDLCAIPGTSLLASVGAGTANNVISYSADNGVTWNNWGSINIQYLNIDFVSPSTGWAGSFTDATTVGVGGLYKYSGALLTDDAFAGFIPTNTNPCTPITTTISNYSTGNPALTYTWSVIPPAAISNSTASNPQFTFTNPGVYSILLTASNGTSTSTQNRVVDAVDCTGLVNNNTSLPSIAVYPNPTKNIVNIEVSNAENYNLVLSDLLGRIVISKKVEGQGSNEVIDLSGQKTGIYLLTIKGSNGSKTTKKIILE